MIDWQRVNAMKRNLIQFWKGPILNEFMKQYGDEAKRFDALAGRLRASQLRPRQKLPPEHPQAVPDGLALGGLPCNRMG